MTPPYCNLRDVGIEELNSDPVVSRANHPGWTWDPVFALHDPTDLYAADWLTALVARW